MPGYIASTTVTWLVRHYSTGFNAIHAIMYWLAFAADVSCGIPHSHRHMDIGLIYTNRFSGTMQKSAAIDRSEEHTSELQSLMRISYAVFCLKKNNYTYTTQ